MFQVGNELTADVNGSTHETRILGTLLPAVDVSGTYTTKGFDAHATLHEPGVPLQARVQRAPGRRHRRQRRGQARRSSRVSPRLKPYFGGRGVADLQLKAHIEKNKLDAHVDADVRDFEDGLLSFKSSKITGRATGPLDAAPTN